MRDRPQKVLCSAYLLAYNSKGALYNLVSLYQLSSIYIGKKLGLSMISYQLLLGNGLLVRKLK